MSSAHRMSFLFCVCFRSEIHIVCLFIILKDMMQCIAYATADQYHLPTLCHDLIAHGFVEINELPRGERSCLRHIT